MSEQSQGAMVHEILGRFIEEEVARSVQEQMVKMADVVEKRAEDLMAAGATRLNQTLNQTLDRATADIEKRVHQMVETGLRKMTTEAERLVERNAQRVQEVSQKTIDDMPVTIQESLMQMTHENETIFHRRAEEWMAEFRAEQSADMSLVVQAQFDAMRRSMLEEVAQSSKAICDRNLFDVRSDFENHVSRSFQNLAERLTAPFGRN
jgi:predicted P-loop ATPase/GTPase